MSQVKHAPATALPWACEVDTRYADGWIAAADAGDDDSYTILRPDAHGRIQPKDKRKVADRHLTARDVQDMQYATHAANAYPDLVEEVRSLRARLAFLCSEEARGYSQDNSTWLDSSEALLNRIGEAQS